MEAPLVPKAKAKLRMLIRATDTGKVFSNLDHENDDAPTSPQKKFLMMTLHLYRMSSGKKLMAMGLKY